MASEERDRGLRALALGSLGDGQEIYDFVIFALFAASLRRTFFPDKTAALQLSAVFVAGNLVRPFGGLLFSHFGDRFGRRIML